MHSIRLAITHEAILLLNTTCVKFFTHEKENINYITNSMYRDHILVSRELNNCNFKIQHTSPLPAETMVFTDSSSRIRNL